MNDWQTPNNHERGSPPSRARCGVEIFGEVRSTSEKIQPVPLRVGERSDRLCALGVQVGARVRG